MKIYTKTGDQGETGLLGGERVSKGSLQVEAYGTVDELSAFLGLSRAQNVNSDLEKVLQKIQHHLFGIGAELSQSEQYRPKEQHFTPISSKEVEDLEQWIDSFEKELVPLQNFILPGGTPLSAALHLGRCVCRRAERVVVNLGESKNIPSEMVIYLNRLSDLLFVMARVANHRAGVEDLKWE